MTVVDLRHLTLQQRLALPSTAIVRTSTGALVTIKALRDQHAARLTQFSAAGTLGATVNAQLAYRAQTLFGDSGRPVPPVVLIPSGEWGHAPADYKDFCTAARATVCLYFPASLGTGGFVKIPPAIKAVDVDPLMDSSKCSAAGGAEMSNEWGFGPGCYLIYPAVAKNYYVVSPGVRSIASCRDSIYDWSSAQGDVMAELIWAVSVVPNGISQMPLVPASNCVVQVYGKARPAPPDNSNFPVPTPPRAAPPM